MLLQFSIVRHLHHEAVRYDRPPVEMTFLAPADRCNQSCPACAITEVVGEPVQRFELSPQHYSRFVECFVEAEIPILTVSFQGYEVTLPRSWPYVEAVFRVAQKHGLRRFFVTNGMLLHKWTDRILDLDVGRINVSLDGATSEVNDPIRGLPGAFEATLQSMRTFLSRAPRYRSRLVVGSIVHDETNFRSLFGMPALLRSLGLSRWVLGFGLARIEGRVHPVTDPATLRT